MPHIPQPVPTNNGYKIMCPICKFDLNIVNSPMLEAERSRDDAQIHLLCHLAWMQEETVFPGEGHTPGT